MASRSLADLLDQLLQPPRRAFKFVGLIGAVLAMIVASIVLTLWFLQRFKILPDEAKVEGFEVHFSNNTFDRQNTSLFLCGSPSRLARNSCPAE